MPYERGHVRHPNKDALLAASAAVHGPRLRAMAFQAPAAWDSRTLNLIPPIKDQGSCGSCWNFSGTDVCDVAFLKAGIFPPDGSGRFSEQYTMDCGRNGGCNGDDNVTVLDWSKKTGLPLASDYGPYQARSSSCKVGSKKLYKIDDWLFLDGAGGSGVTPTDKIKAGIMLYGLVGVAGAAGGDWDNAGPGHTITGRSRGINHDISLVGWDDNHDNGDGSKGAWILRNNWGTQWGDKGYCWIKWGADSIGTEAVAAYVAAVDSPIDWSDV